MNWKHYLAPALMLGFMAPLPAAAQADRPQPQVQQPERQDPQTPERRDVQMKQNIIRADRLIGQTVRDRQNDRLGRINDLAVNVQDGRIAYAVVNRGGMWGIGGDDVALPWQQVQPDPAARIVRLDEQQLQQAKKIDTDQAWPERIGEGAVGTTGAARDRRVLPMSNILGMDVQNKQGERLGRIDEIAIQRDGSLAYVVIAHGGFLGMGDNYVAVPWDRVSVNAQREEAVLDVTQEQLERAKSFEYRESWPERVDWPFGGNR